MANELILQNPAYDRVVDPLAFAKEMGRAIALSRMFGCETEAQGVVMAWECMARRMPPLMIAERYHVIYGKLSLKAESMLADFRAKMKGDYEILERSDTRAAIRLTLGKQTRDFAMTWEEAKLEPFVYEGKEDEKAAALAAGKVDKLRLKAKYATPRSRFQMLWARVVSDGVRAMAPEVTSGGYTPEEIDDIHDDAVGGNGQSSTSVVTAEVQTAEATKDPPEGYANAGQVANITNLLVQLGATHEEQEAIKKKRGVSAWRNLTGEQANELVAKLVAKLEASKLPATAMTAEVATAPCTQAKIDECKGVIRELAQNADQKIAERVQAKLKESGLSKLADLTMAECDSLIAALRLKNMEAFFAASLAGHKSHEAPPVGIPPEQLPTG